MCLALWKRIFFCSNQFFSRARDISHKLLLHFRKHFSLLREKPEKRSEWKAENSIKAERQIGNVISCNFYIQRTSTSGILLWIIFNIEVVLENFKANENKSNFVIDLKGNEILRDKLQSSMRHKNKCYRQRLLTQSEESNFLIMKSWSISIATKELFSVPKRLPISDIKAVGCKLFTLLLLKAISDNWRFMVITSEPTVKINLRLP